MILNKRNFVTHRPSLWQDKESKNVSKGWHVNSDRTQKMNAEFFVRKHIEHIIWKNSHADEDLD